MAQDIEIANAQYNDVPSIEVPKQGGGTAEFVDTSDADAIADDISVGKTAYVNGVKLTGTGSGGVVPQETYYRAGNLVELADYSGGWVSSYSIGSPISISSTGRTDWRIRKAQLLEKKNYLISTFLTDGDSYPFILVDANNKVLAVPQGLWYGNRLCFLDTSNYDDSNGLYICVGCGNLNFYTYHFNEIPSGYFGRGYVYCLELLTYGGQS